MWQKRLKCWTQISEWSNYPNVMLGLMLVMGFMFPLHFSNFGEKTSKKEREKLKKKQSTLLKSADIIPMENLQLKYAQLETEMEEMDKTYLEFQHLNNTNRDLETIIETYASSVVLISIWLMSLEHEQLKLFLNSTFEELLPDNYKLLIALVGAMSALNCVFCVIRIR